MQCAQSRKQADKVYAKRLNDKKRFDPNCFSVSHLLSVLRTQFPPQLSACAPIRNAGMSGEVSRIDDILLDAFSAN